MKKIAGASSFIGRKIGLRDIIGQDRGTTRIHPVRIDRYQVLQSISPVMMTQPVK
jgi:hypothetical protein